MLRQRVEKTLASPFTGLTVMCGALVWQAIGSNWGAAVVYVAASFQTIGAQFLENWRLKADREPRVKIVYNPEGPNGRLYDSLHHDGTLRIIRVGVMNTGTPVHRVAVLVSRIEPQQEHVFHMQALQQTHQADGVSRFTVNRSAEPLVFVDLIWQNITEQTEPVNAGATWQMRMAFADGQRELSLAVSEYLIWLSIDGEGAEASRKFILRRNSVGQYDMEPAMFG